MDNTNVQEYNRHIANMVINSMKHFLHNENNIIRGGGSFLDEAPQPILGVQEPSFSTPGNFHKKIAQKTEGGKLSMSKLAESAGEAMVKKLANKAGTAVADKMISTVTGKGGAIEPKKST